MPSTPKVDPSEVLAVERATALRSFRFYCKEVLGLDFVEHVHGDIMDLFESGDFDEALIMLPRGCFKSSIGAAYTSWRVVQDRNFRCLIVGVTFKKAVEVCYLTRQYLESERVVELFGSFESDVKWSTEEWIVSGRTRNLREPTVSVMGRDSFKPGGHYDLVWFDDPEDSETVSTPEQIKKTQDVDALSYPMADEPGAKRLTTGTFWDDLDLYSMKIERFHLYVVREVSGKRQKVRPRMIRKEQVFDLGNGNEYRLRVVSFYKPAIDPETDELLFPEKLGHAALARAKASMTASHFAAQYLLDPVSKENATYEPTDFKYDYRKPDRFRRFIGVDVAHSGRADSDFIGITVADVGDEFSFYVHEARRYRLDSRQLWQKLADLDEEYGADGVIPWFCIEEDHYVKGWKPFFLDWLRSLGRMLRIEWIVSFSRQNKEQRIEAMQPLFRGGNVTIKPGETILEEELVRFPNGRYRDVADSFSNIVETARKPMKEKALPPGWGNFRLRKTPLLSKVGPDGDRNPLRRVTDTRSSLKY